jgi:hypothetical protein
MWAKNLFLGEKDWAHLTEAERKARMDAASQDKGRLASRDERLRDDPKYFDEKYVGLRGANIGRVKGRGSAMNGMLEDERRVIRENNLRPDRD